ncbi:hypothetical protein E0L15_05010 [Pseudoflavonifractor sp. SW1122]|uniref:hypothetical protein n=1 Tax=Pseudoflavonifractor sp. SW1122 TaxID=2530044 RepID=UPI00143BEE38|nr:hypothetical protein [Pseudoflavonifractor sp. SW1122]NJE73969.1 hypothetical protein [Pseudoflavonifractor sp. SW1122]
MKKSTFVAMLLGTISGVLFALGMCMALIPDWYSFGPGVALGCAGIVLGLVTVAVWQHMEHKQPIQISRKAVASVAVGIVGALTLGVGMCFTMVWNQLVLGIGIGLVGIVVLLCLLPLTKGIRA